MSVHPALIPIHPIPSQGSLSGRARLALLPFLPSQSQPQFPWARTDGRTKRGRTDFGQKDKRDEGSKLFSEWMEDGEGAYKAKTSLKTRRRGEERSGRGTDGRPKICWQANIGQFGDHFQGGPHRRCRSELQRETRSKRQVDDRVACLSVPTKYIVVGKRADASVRECSAGIGDFPCSVQPLPQVKAALEKQLF